MNTISIIIITSLITLCAAVVLISQYFYRRFPFLAIYKSKLHLEDAFDSFDDPLAIISHDYHILRANKAYSSLVKKNYGELLGQRCYTMLRGRSEPCEDCLLKNTLKKGQKEYVERSEHPHEGNKSAISLGFFPFMERNSHEVKSVVEHIRDITALETLKDKLEEKNVILTKMTKELQAAQDRFTEEIRLAREVQQSVLPDHIPGFDGLDIVVTYKPIEEVGGDIYDFIPFSPNRMGIFIGDASGHGLPAAFVTMLSKMSLYNHTKHEVKPSRMLHNLNLDLLKNVTTSHYLTCFWMVYDSNTNVINFARAGHPKPVVIRKDGQCFELAAAGTFLGIMDKIKFQESSFTCEKGDRIYLFTDGVFMTEIEDGRKRVALNNEKFKDILLSVNPLPFGEVIPAIKKQISGFTCEDDYTLLVIEVTADPQAPTE